MARDSGDDSAASKAKSTAQDATDKAQSAAASAEDHPAADWVTTAGQFANGLVHVMIGVLAFGIAFGAGGSADQSGAMRALQQTPFGGIALWAVGIAMVALAVHAVVSAIAASRSDGKEAVGNAGRAIAYAAVGSTALVYAVGGSSDGEQSTESLTSTLMGNPLGLLLVGAIGLVVAGIGLYFLVKGVRQKFRKEVAPPRRFRRLVGVLGTTGYVAKGVAVIVVGALFVMAAVQHDAEEAGGLDGALQSLTTVPGGVIVLIGIAVGLLLYGAYCFARGAWPR